MVKTLNDESFKCHLILAGLSGFYACHSNDKALKTDTLVTQVKDTDAKVITEPVHEKIVKQSQDTIVKLSYGFKIRIDIGSGSKDCDNLHLFHNGKKIDLGIRDSSSYIIEDKLYPIINKVDDSTFEILIEEANNPNKNLLSFFRIKNDSLVEKRQLPTFFAKASDLDGDGILEYAGFLDNGEIYERKGKTLRTVDPILYYKITQNGIKLDSTLTIERNKILYGKFYGFTFDSKTGVDIRSGCNTRIEKEVLRIVNNVKR